MKETLHKITATLMALIVLLSTMSFSLDMHYCGDRLVDFSMFDKVDTCMMKAEKSKDSSVCEVMEMETKTGCCSDLEVTIEGQDDLKISFDKLTFEQQQFVFSFTYSFINLYKEADENKVPFRDYVPPPLLRDVQILDQTFLI
ncbi:HYC_CC_PP family protein [Maribacter sp. 2308TA10-17]|uniref:HYC_CC_PP family protein n=1 Tax=Maribacter sp. 2308TA10-17 TaxID=3386276 RepID=UPI0039BD1A07